MGSFSIDRQTDTSQFCAAQRTTALFFCRTDRHTRGKEGEKEMKREKVRTDLQGRCVAWLMSALSQARYPLPLNILSFPSKRSCCLYQVSIRVHWRIWDFLPGILSRYRVTLLSSAGFLPHAHFISTDQWLCTSPEPPNTASQTYDHTYFSAGLDEGSVCERGG